MQLNFIQSNWLRQYPFRAGCGGVDLSYNQMPTDLIVALHITVDTANSNIYISKVITDNGIISISFNSSIGSVGFANGVINSSNQSLLIKNYNNGVIGNVTIGNIASTIPKQTYTFNIINGLIEGSTIMILPRPAVTGLLIKHQNVVGMVTLTSNSLTINTDTQVNLSVNFPDSITSRGDLCARNLTCENPTISGINNVTPDLNGNIDLYAIEPLTVSVAVVDGITQLQLSTPTLNYDNLCVAVNTPPTNTNQDPTAPIDIITEPEYHNWPQFQT